MALTCDLCGKTLQANRVDQLIKYRVRLIKLVTTEEGTTQEIVNFDLCEECQNKVVNAIENKTL